MKCKNCQEELVEQAKYCHHCGLIIHAKYSFMNGIKGNEFKKVVERTLELENENIKLIDENKKVKKELIEATEKSNSLFEDIQGVVLRNERNFVGIGRTGTQGDINFVTRGNSSPNAILQIHSDGNIGLGSELPIAQFHITSSSGTDQLRIDNNNSSFRTQ